MLVVALLGGSAAAFAVTERLKLERSPIFGTQVGKVVSSHVIPRPHDDVASVLKRKFVR